jgi:hypothetical protein
MFRPYREGIREMRVGKRMYAGIGCILVSTMLILETSAASPGELETNGNGIRISVFECYMPIEKDFVLNTHDESRFTFFLVHPRKTIHITIARYAAVLGESFSLDGSRQFEDLWVEELRNSMNSDTRVTRIHDKQQQIMIYGSTDDVVEALLEGCKRQPRGELYSQ